MKPHYERGTLAETYEKIEKDLELGLKLIDDAIYEVPKYHFNRAAANAYAARFYVFTRQYDKALECANAAFNGSDPATMMSDIWANRGSMYYISDIGRYYTSMKRANVFMDISTYSTSSRRFHSNRYTCNRDARRSTIQGPGPSWEGIKFKNSKTGETFSMHPGFNGLCGTAGKAEYGSYFGGISSEQFEYTDKVSGTLTWFAWNSGLRKLSSAVQKLSSSSATSTVVWQTSSFGMQLVKSLAQVKATLSSQ